MKLYDTFRRKKREFKPVKGKAVRIYTCGPSVYNYAHIGNFRTYLFEDVLVRYLIYKGYRIKRVMNITDVEDKAIETAKKENVSLNRLEADKIRIFFKEFDKLNMQRPDVVAKASKHLPQIVRLIRRICAKGYCREERDGIYFDVRKFRRYGNLRRLDNKRYRGVMRKDDYAKEGAWDFRLWKFWSKKDGENYWGSRFGKGRPGWHIECSAIAMHYLGDNIDIHCGGTDNIFPHHENEIAQSEAASGKKFVNFWLHARHLTIRKKKMSKRMGNVMYVSELEKKGVPPKCLRYYLISEKYRNKLDFTIPQFRKKIVDCRQTREKIAELRRITKSGNGKLGRKIADRLARGFVNAMDDDLNTKLAFKRIFREMKTIAVLIKEGRLTREDAKEILNAVKSMDSVLGVF